MSRAMVDETPATLAHSVHLMRDLPGNPELVRYIIPQCVRNDPNTKKGVNCVSEDDVSTAIHLLSVLKPELHKRAVANECFDTSIKSHMTESDIVNFCMTNYAIKDGKQIKNDLRNLEILTFNNPEWGLSILQTDDNNGQVSKDDVAKNMEQVIFNYDFKITSLALLNPELPWKCTFYKSFYTVLNSFLFILLVFGSLYLANLGFKYYKHYEQKQKDEIGLIVEKIIDILQSSINEEGGDNFVVINHVRDMILPVTDRKKKEKVWAKAVKFINENESRARVEVQIVQGEPFEVWRWIGSANLSMAGDRSDYVYRHGRRIVDAQYLISEVLKFPHKSLRFCLNSDVIIKNEVREGFLSILLLQCKKCKNEHPVCSEDPNSELLNVNLALVAGIISIGLSLYHLNELCSSLHVPAVSGADYNSYLDEIFEIYNESITESEKSRDTSFSKRVLRSSTPKTNESLTDIEKIKDKSFNKRTLRSSTSKNQIADDTYDIKKQKFLKELEKSPEEIEKLSHQTLTQSDNPLWHRERKKRLTASNFGRICKLLHSTDRKKVAQELLHSNFSGNIFTRYGNDNELNAVKDFEKLLGLTVTSCGLFIHQNYPFLAASPDGLLGPNAIIEIKCPYKAKDLTPEEAIKQKQIQYGTFEDGVFRLKRSDKYYFQVQGQLFVTGKEVCYFIVWTPLGLVYEEIFKDEEFWNKMFPKLEEFYFEHLLPVILEEY